MVLTAGVKAQSEYQTGAGCIVSVFKPSVLILMVQDWNAADDWQDFPEFQAGVFCA